MLTLDPFGLEYRVIGTRSGVPMVMDTNTGQVTVGFPTNYVDPITRTLQDGIRTAGKCYLKTMDTVSEFSDFVRDTYIPDQLEPSGKPYPGFWGEVGRLLGPIRDIIKLYR